MAFANETDLTTRYDDRLIGQLASDSNVQATVSGNARVQAALSDAEAIIRAAIQRGNRYTDDVLDQLAASNDGVLKRITCDMALGFLYAARGGGVPDQHQRVIDRADEEIRAIEDGSHVLAVEAAKLAGQVDSEALTVVEREFFGRMSDSPYFPRQRRRIL